MIPSAIVSRAWIFAFVALLPVLSYGQPAGPMAFSVFWPCMGNASFCAPRIFAEGVIERDSHSKLSAFLSSTKTHGHQLLPKPAVCFNSPGGDLAGAMELGRVIRRLGFDTCLAPNYSRVIPGTGGDEEAFARNVVCASACAFAMVGGVNRLIEDHSRYGVHQFYGIRGNIGDSSTQVTVVMLAAYLEQMGISRSLLDTASLVAPKDIYWLTTQELSALGVDNMVTVVSQWKLDALDDGTVVATISQVKPGAQIRVSLTVLKSKGQPVLLIALTPGQRDSKSFKDALDAVNREPITLRIDGRQVAIYGSAEWRVVRESVVVGLPLSAHVVGSLRTGRLLGLQVSVRQVYGQYDPSLDFPLDRVGPLLAAALK